MNDLPTSLTPWLRTRTQFDQLAADQGSRVILPPAADGDAVSLRRALRWTLQGDTRSFNAVVGYFHQSAPAEDDTDRRLTGDPASLMLQKCYQPTLIDGTPSRLFDGLMPHTRRASA